MRLFEYGYHADIEPATPRGGDPGGSGSGDPPVDRSEDEYCDTCGEKLVKAGSKTYCMHCKSVDEVVDYASDILAGKASARSPKPNTRIIDTYDQTTQHNSVLKTDNRIPGGESETNEMVTSAAVGSGMPSRMPVYGCPVCKAQFPFSFMGCPACHTKVEGEVLHEDAEVSDKVKRLSGTGIPRMIRIKVLGNNKVKIVAPGINTVSDVYTFFNEPHIYLPRTPLQPFVTVNKIAEWYHQSRIGDMFTIDTLTGWTILTNEKTGEANTLGYAW